MAYVPAHLRKNNLNQGKEKSGPIFNSNDFPTLSGQKVAAKSANGPKYSDLGKEWGMKQKVDAEAKQKADAEAKLKEDADRLKKQQYATDASMLKVGLGKVMKSLQTKRFKEEEPELDIGCNELRYELDENDLIDDVIVDDDTGVNDDDYVDDSHWNNRRHNTDLY